MKQIEWLKIYWRKLIMLPSTIQYKIWKKRLDKRIQTENDRVKIHVPMKDSPWPVVTAAIILLVIGLVIAVFGSIKTGAFPSLIVSDFYANVATEFVSIAITVLIIDSLNSWRTNKYEKEKILHQLSSRSNDFALDAVRIADEQGWLRDGSLFNYHLNYANLKNAKFDHCFLRSVHFFAANLESANFSNSNLERAFMEGANLFNADLSRANLKDAVLYGSKLVGANLWAANLEEAGLINANLEGAILLQANLKGAILERVKLKNAIYDKFTVWPENFNPKENGAIFNDNEIYGRNPITGGMFI